MDIRAPLERHDEGVPQWGIQLQWDRLGHGNYAWNYTVTYQG